MRSSSRIRLQARSSRKRTAVALYDPEAEAARPQSKKAKKAKPTPTPKQRRSRPKKARTPPPAAAPVATPPTPVVAPPAAPSSPATPLPASSGPAPNIPLGVVDELCTTPGTLVACPSGGLYEALLEYTDAATNSDKFYVLQMIQSASGEYHVFQRWGRRGSKGQQKTDSFDAEDGAVKYFEKKFKSKTGVDFNQRDAADRDGKYKMAKRLREAGAGEGEVAVSLIWENSGPKRNDLDLHVMAPSGETIFYLHKQSRCGGVLDVDRMQNAEEPVENIVWKKAPKGKYKIYVHNFSASHQDATPFQVGLRLKGGEREMIHGTMPAKSASGEKLLIKEFTHS